MRTSLINSGPFKKYKAVMADGSPVWRRAADFRKMLEADPKVGKTYADMLAQPRFAEEADHADWYIPFEPENGKGFRAVKWSEATDAGRKTAYEQLRDFQQRLAAFGLDIAARNISDPLHSYTHFLVDGGYNSTLPALHFPHQDCVYIVDGKPVVTFWGFCDAPAGLSFPPFDALPLTVAAPPAAAVAPWYKKRRAWFCFLLLLLLLSGLYFFGCEPREKEENPPVPVNKAANSPAADPAAGEKEQPKQEKPLVLTPQALKSGDVKILNGTWQTRSSLSDADTGKPLHLSYTFKDGRGTTTLTREEDGSKCTGKSRVVISNGTVKIIQDGLVRCAGGDKYEMPEITCALAENGRTDCKGDYGVGEKIEITLFQ